jgi:hypothetical protein
MKKYNTIIFLLFTLLNFAQSIEKVKPVHGQLISDVISVNNVSVVNRTSKTETVTSTDGSFTINSKPKDTLYFNSPDIITMQYVVDEVDFNIELKVNVYPKSSMLDEIVIYRHNLTGNIGMDSRSLPTYYRDLDSEIKQKVTGLDLTSEEQNSRKLVTTLEQNMPGVIKSRPYDMDFVAIGKAVGKLFKKEPKLSENQKIKENVYLMFEKNNLAEQLSMTTTDLNYYLDYLIASEQLNNKKVKNYDALTLLEVLVNNQKNYYTYLLEEIK